MADMKTLEYQPKDKDGKKQEPWRKSFPEAQAAKMVKMGRWKYATDHVGQSSKK